MLKLLFSTRICENGLSSMVHDPIKQRIYISTYKVGEIHILDSTTFNFIKTLKTEISNKISKLILLKNGTLYAIGDSIFSVFHEDDRIFTFKPHAWTRSLTLFKDENFFISGGSSDGLKKFSVSSIQQEDPKSLMNLQGNSWIYSISNIGDKFYGYNVSNNSDYIIRDLIDDSIVNKIINDDFSTTLCSLVFDKYLLLGTYNGNIYFIEIGEWTIYSVVKLGTPIASMALLPNKMLVTSHYRGEIHLVDLQTFEVEKVSKITDRDLDDILMVGNHLIACDDSGEIHVFLVHQKVIGFLKLLKKPTTLDIKFLFQ
jgi:hypothetical protein